MNNVNPYTPPSSNVVASDIPNLPPPKAIGGWLILVAIGITLTPIRIVADGLGTYARIFSNGYWSALTTPGSAAYIPFWQAAAIGETAVNAAMVVAWIYICVQFFKKKAKFPNLYIYMAVFTIVFQLVDAFIFGSIAPDGEMFDKETTTEIFRSFVSALIWIPYMLRSKRVKETFVA